MRQNYARHDAAGLISIKHLKLFTGANTMPQWRAFEPCFTTKDTGKGLASAR